MSSPVPVSNVTEQNIIVIDPGSGYVKAGWAGEDSPRVVIPSIVLNLSTQSVPPAVTEAFGDVDWVFGNDALAALQLASESSAKHNLHAVRPIERGIIKEWEAFEKLIEHIVHRHLHVRDPAQHPLLIAVSPNSRPQTRHEITRRLFKSLSFPSIIMQNSSSLGIFSTGRTTAMAIDIGEGTTSVVPVFEGFALPHALKVIPVAGADITRAVMQCVAVDNAPSSVGQMLARSAQPPLAHLQLARSLKERLCVCLPKGVRHTDAGVAQVLENTGLNNAGSFVGLTADIGPDGGATVELDGSVLTASLHTRVAPVEVLFSPSLVQDYARAVSEARVAGTCSVAAFADVYEDLAHVHNPSSFILPKETSITVMNYDATAHTSGHIDPHSREFRDRRAMNAVSFTHHTPLPLSLSTLPLSSPVIKLVSNDLSQRPLAGLSQLVFDCLNLCDEELKQDLLNSIVIIGGGALTAGIAERLKQELLDLLNHSKTPTIVCDSRRQHACWIGGSMLASLPTIKLLRVTQAEFEADPTIVQKRYF